MGRSTRATTRTNTKQTDAEMETNHSERGDHGEGSEPERNDNRFQFTGGARANPSDDEEEPKFCVLLRLEHEQHGAPPKTTAWTSEIAQQILSPYLDALPALTEVVILAPGELLLFHGRRNRSEGWTRQDAESVRLRLDRTLDWVTEPMEARTRALSLAAGRDRLRDAVKMKRREKARKQRGRRNSPGSRQKRANHRPLRQFPGLGHGNVSDAGSSVDNPRDRGDVGGPPGSPPPSDGEDSDSSLNSTYAGSTTSYASSRESRRGNRQRERRQRRELGKIELPIFQGENAADQNAVSYRHWRWDVQMHLHLGHSPRAVLKKIYSTLRGHPGELVRFADLNTPIHAVLETLDCYYGDVMTFDAMSAELYTMSQGGMETVAEFGMRVDRMIRMISVEFPDKLPAADVSSRLIDRFYEGLDPDLKRSVAHKRDTPGITYERLMADARRAEKSNNHRAKHYTASKKDPQNLQNAQQNKPPTDKPYNPYPRKPRGFVQYSSARAGRTEESTATWDADSGTEYAGEVEEPLQYSSAEIEEALHVLNSRLNVPQRKKAPTERLNPRPEPVEKAQRSLAEMAESQCYNCQGYGHFAKSCPTSREVGKKLATKNMSREGREKAAPPSPGTSTTASTSNNKPTNA